MSFFVTDLSPVRGKDGVIYQSGQEIPGLNEEAAASLLELGVITEKRAKPPKND